MNQSLEATIEFAEVVDLAAHELSSKLYGLAHLIETSNPEGIPDEKAQRRIQEGLAHIMRDLSSDAACLSNGARLENYSSRQVTMAGKETYTQTLRRIISESEAQQ